MSSGASRFDLPFQWDDGRFVSPFVESTAATIDALCHVVLPTILGRGGDRTAAGAAADTDDCFTFVDLGCGDGRVVAGVAARFPHCTAVGIDLDEALIAAACADERYAAWGDRLHFVVGDIVDASRTAAPTTHVERGHAAARAWVQSADVIFCYLLPEALVTMRPAIEQLTAHWSKHGGVAGGAGYDDESCTAQRHDGGGAGARVRAIVSNLWPVPYLERYAQPWGSAYGLVVYAP
jgi:SAM-dependent methyltransferase